MKTLLKGKSRKTKHIPKSVTCKQTFSVIMCTIKNKLMKKSASTTEITEFNQTNLKLREAKSYGDKMSELSSSNSSVTEKLHELSCKNDRKYDYDDKFVLVSKDRLTQEIVYLSTDILSYKGKKYDADDIAPSFKKDCRMWLWKNYKISKKSRLDKEYTQ